MLAAMVTTCSAHQIEIGPKKSRCQIQLKTWNRKFSSKLALWARTSRDCHRFCLIRKHGPDRIDDANPLECLELRANMLDFLEIREFLEFLEFSKLVQ